jgi:hypothetical protein
MTNKRSKAHQIGHWTKKRVQICTTEKWRVCAGPCGRKRMLKFFYTSSKNLTKVCSDCRKEHDEEVAMTGVASTINPRSMDNAVFCEKCGAALTIREMSAHHKICITGRIYDIPGIKPPGVFAEDE